MRLKHIFGITLYDCLHRYSSQLEAQQKETASASATLEEAAREMDLIRTEKKALLQKWRSSLLQIERCDEQLTATEFASRQWKEKEMSIDGEITSFRKSIKNEQEKNELLVGQVTKVRSEAGYLEKQIETCMSEHAQLTEQFNLFKLSLERAEAELKEADGAKKSVLDEQVSQLVVKRIHVTAANNCHAAGQSGQERGAYGARSAEAGGRH